MNSNIHTYFNSLSRSCTTLLMAALLSVLPLLLSGCEQLIDTTTTGPDPSQEQAAEDPAVQEGEVQAAQGQDNGNSGTDETAQEPQGNSQDDVEETVPRESEDADQEEVPQTVTINVYFADQMGEYLVGEARTIPYEHRYSNALVELMKLPVDEKLIKLIPDTASINSLDVKEGTAYVDFSRKFVEDRFVSDTADILLVYSIVNTLTEFPDINSVVLNIEGEKLDILGMLDLSEPLYRKSDLILK